MTNPQRILLVDDDPAVRSSLAFALELEDFQVETFETGELLAERGLLPDDACLVLDYKLPGLDGLSLLRQLRANGARLPAVLITSNPPERLRRATVAAGAALIEKPLLCDALSRSIRSLIDTAHG
ncbi:response regulator [Sphingomonas sp.]|uniref:response regulator n=1 Tax=Sphingomonas sp. TaxID=28214 RepID=UPI002DBC90DA|nr:response regulator [Sphingomonas sp.]